MNLAFRYLCNSLFALVALVSLSTSAFAQYPDRPITVVVPFAAGGPTDVVARLVGNHMARTLGQTFVIENVAGAGGTSGMTRVSQAAPDGYTIGIGNIGTQAAAPALYPELKYDPTRSFAPIGIVNYTPQAIVAKNTLEPKNLKELVAYLQANSSRMTYGHAGVGSISHVSGMLFNSKFGLEPTLVPYRGTGPALQDLVSGHFDYIIDQSLNVLPQINAGTIRAYAIAAPKRLEALPDVPTTAEGGVDFIFSAWAAMVAPKGTPHDIVGKLADALAKALDDLEIKQRFRELASTGPEGADRGPWALQKLVESEVARIGPLIKAAGVSVK